MKPDRAESGLTRHARAFWAGFTELSALSLWTCLALSALMATMLLWLFNPNQMSGPMGDYIPRSTKDHDAFALVEALRIAEEDPKVPSVLFLGSSTVAQMVAEGREIEDALAMHTAEDWHIRVLTTPLQSPLDQLRLLETALANRSNEAAPMIVILGMGLSRVGWTKERLLEPDTASRIPLSSNWVNDELALLGESVDAPHPIWAIEQKDFIVLNGMKCLARLFLARPAKRDIDVFAAGAMVEFGADTRLYTQIEKGMATRSSFFNIQRRLAKYLETTQNVTLVFLEEPFLGDALNDGNLLEHARTFNREVAALAEETGAEFWPVMREAALTSDDFFDALHIHRGAGQAKVQDHIVIHLSRLASKLEDET